MSIAISVGLLTAASVYLIMQRGMIRIVLGFVLISHAVNLLIFSAGNVAFRDIPYIGSASVEGQADPLPQAFVLTAIVIAFSITMFMITLAITTTSDDDTEGEEVTPVKVVKSAIDSDTGEDADLMASRDSDGFISDDSDRDAAGDDEDAQSELRIVAGRRDGDKHSGRDSTGGHND